MSIDISFTVTHGFVIDLFDDCDDYETRDAALADFAESLNIEPDEFGGFDDVFLNGARLTIGDEDAFLSLDGGELGDGYSLICHIDRELRFDGRFTGFSDGGDNVTKFEPLDDDEFALLQSASSILGRLGYDCGDISTLVIANIS